MSGGDLDVWVDDRIITPEDDRTRLLLERGSLPLDPPPGPDLGFVLEVHDKVGSFAGRRWSLTLRLQDAHQRRRYADGAIDLVRTPHQLCLAVLTHGAPAWAAEFRNVQRIARTPDEYIATVMWHWRRYYSFVPAETARAEAETFAATVPAGGTDINELNRAASRLLYAVARAEGWRKLTAFEQRRYGVAGQWHRVSYLETLRQQRLDNPSGCGAATLRMAAGVPTADDTGGDAWGTY